MKWTTRIWMRGIEEIIRHPLAAVAITGGLAWGVTRGITLELLSLWIAETSWYTWRMGAGSAEIVGRRSALAARPVAASLWSRTRVVAANPITWGAALAVGATAADVNLQAKHGAGVWGADFAFGVAPTKHLEGGEPWWN